MSDLTSDRNDPRLGHGVDDGPGPQPAGRMRPERNYLIEVDAPVKVVAVTADGDRSFLLDLDPEAPDYITDGGVPVWIERKKVRTRFLDAEGNQVGPWHANLVPAILSAVAAGWRKPGAPDWWNDTVAEEVARGGAVAHDRPGGKRLGNGGAE